ncbi:MAG TPA: helix-turn-helix transcriptional regulator [Acetobacteraceae bacterium]|nr:helix-turn-helix transcriptional regulator [Acetobacteraceae bacterium]
MGDRDELLEAVGARLREARLKAGMTQGQLAEKVGTSQSYVYLAETGGQNLTLKALHRLATALGSGLRDLLPAEVDAPVSDAAVERLCSALERFADAVKLHRDQEGTLLKEIDRMGVLRDQVARLLSKRRQEH